MLVYSVHVSITLVEVCCFYYATQVTCKLYTSQLLCIMCETHTSRSISHMQDNFSCLTRKCGLLEYLLFFSYCIKLIGKKSMFCFFSVLLCGILLFHCLVMSILSSFLCSLEVVPTLSAIFGSCPSIFRWLISEAIGLIFRNLGNMESVE